MAREHADDIDLTLGQDICILLFLLLEVDGIPLPLLCLLLELLLQVWDIFLALIRHWGRSVVRCSLSSFLIVDEDVIPIDPRHLVLFLLLRGLTH